MIRMKKSRFIMAIVATIIATALVVGIVGYGLMTVSGMSLVNTKKYEKYEDIAEKYGKLYNLHMLIENNFLWDVDEDKMMENVYKSLVESLGDKYSAYYNEDETKKIT